LRSPPWRRPPPRQPSIEDPIDSRECREAQSFRPRDTFRRIVRAMKARLLGAAVATMSVLFFPGVGWAQHGGHAGGGHGGGHTASGHTSGHSGGPAGAAASSGSRGARTAAPVTSAVGVTSLVQSRPLLTRPYYVFRLRQPVCLGLSLGYAVPYPSSFFHPYASLYPYSYYPYPYSDYPYTSPTLGALYATPTPTYPDALTTAPGIVDALPPSGIGGVSFDIAPSDAAVFVDTVYVGTAGDFSATAPPLSLAAGRHHFELRAQGYQTLAFDVDVIPGQVIPYQGTLQLAQPR
jgi:hypothetical protein